MIWLEETTLELLVIAKVIHIKSFLLLAWSRTRSPLRLYSTPICENLLLEEDTMFVLNTIAGATSCR